MQLFTLATALLLSTAALAAPIPQDDEMDPSKAVYFPKQNMTCWTTPMSIDCEEGWVEGAPVVSLIWPLESVVADFAQAPGQEHLLTTTVAAPAATSTA